MVESTDICTCKVHNTKSKFVEAISPFDGKTDHQIKALYLENKEFNESVAQQQIMYDMSGLPPLVITGVMNIQPTWKMTDFQMNAWKTYSDHFDEVRKLLLADIPGATLENPPPLETSAYAWMLEHEDWINDIMPCEMHDGDQEED